MIGALLAAGFPPRWIGDNMTWEEIMTAGTLILEAKGMIKPDKITAVGSSGGPDDPLAKAKELGVLEEG